MIKSGEGLAIDTNRIFTFKTSSEEDELGSWLSNAEDSSTLQSKISALSPGLPMTECDYCQIIRDNDVSQEFLSLDFNERHISLSDRSIQAIHCLPWLRLSMKEREKVLENNRFRCKVCLRTLEYLSKNRSCGDGRHMFDNGNNEMCSIRRCEKNVTICHDHLEVNIERHSTLRQCIDWTNRVRPQPKKQHLHWNDGDNLSYEAVCQPSILQE